MSPEELVRACAGSDDGAAWDEFVSRFQRPISLSILRVSRQSGDVSGRVVDDLTQETYLKLCADKCRRLLEFTALHPEATLGYIKTIAANVARDYFRSERAGKRGAGKGESLTDVSQFSQDEKQNPANSIECRVLLAQIEQVVQKCSAGPEQCRDQMIFWLYYRLGMTAKNIAALPTVGLTAKGVESAILRLTRLVRDHLTARALASSSGTEEAPKGF
jgi:RNA polymerase sigma-70 factor, ECF subfamily